MGFTDHCRRDQRNRRAASTQAAW